MFHAAHPSFRSKSHSADEATVVLSGSVLTSQKRYNFSIYATFLKLDLFCFSPTEIWSACKHTCFSFSFFDQFVYIVLFWPFLMDDCSIIQSNTNHSSHLFLYFFFSLYIYSSLRGSPVLFIVWSWMSHWMSFLTHIHLTEHCDVCVCACKTISFINFIYMTS